MGSFRDKPVITHILYHPLPIRIPPNMAIKLKISFFFFSLVVTLNYFLQKRNFQEGLTFPCYWLLAQYRFWQQFLIFKKDILTLTGTRRWGAFVTFLLSPVISCCSRSQMVRFSAHMFVFLGDHHSWPAWQKSMCEEMKCTGPGLDHHYSGEHF